MRRPTLALFGLLALLGLGLTVWANVGDTAVMASTGPIYQAMVSHGQGDNFALRDDLYAVVLQIQWPWTAVQWMGLAVLALALGGLVVTSRSRE